MDNLTAKISEIDWRSMTPAEIDTLLVERIRIYEEAIAMRGGKRPKREGCIIEKMASMWNLQAADDEAQKGKKTRTVKRRGKTIRVLHRHIRRHNERREQELRALQMMILTLDFPECKFSLEKVKTDAGKVRIIAKQDFYPWRILQHAILRVIEPKAYASIIPGSFACIKGRGLHYGVRLLKRQLRRHPELKWMWKTDFKKFYPSIPHELMEREFSALFKDAHFIALVRLVLLTTTAGMRLKKYSMKRLKGQRGMPIGAVVSQMSGNLAGKRIDHAVVFKGKNHCYLRYCDDALGLARTKAEARRQLQVFYEKATELGLCVKSNIIISPIGHERKQRQGRKRRRQRSHRRKTD